MKKRNGVIAVCVCAAILVAVIVGDFLFSREFSADFQAMNTVVSLDAKGLHSRRAVEEIKAEIIRLDEKILSRTSEESEIHALNSGKTKQASDELSQILASLKQLEEESGGAFRADLGQLTDLWGIGTANENVPDEAAISAAIAGTGSWQTDGTRVTLSENTRLDLGAAGKGIACDYACSLLEQLKCKSAVVAVGGSVLLYSANGSESFRVGVRDPSGNANDYCMILNTAPCCISTSGNYERFFKDENGRIYHHIFDPSTGYPADSGIISVTVSSQSGAVSDVLSTACFVLGIEKSLPLLEKYDADAIFITTDNRIVTTYENAKDIITVTNDSYSFGEPK